MRKRNMVRATCCMFAVLIFIGCSERAEPEVHLIPEGFTGPVVIIFGDSSATPVRYEGESRVYDIPESGVLRTSSDVNEGVRLESEYFYVDEDGDRTAISQAYGSQQPDGVAIYHRLTGGTECESHSGRVISQLYIVAEADAPNKLSRTRAFADSVICPPRSSSQQ